MGRILQYGNHIIKETIEIQLFQLTEDGSLLSVRSRAEKGLAK
jgi:hypothetical protein